MTHFIIIGATRCGTTSLYNYLGAHPRVNLARGHGRREVHFFDYGHLYQNGIDWYRAQFKPNTVTGETSPTMLQHWLAPERLKLHIPDCRVIALLRNPVDRAYSDYWHAKGKGHVQRSFRQEIADEAKRLQWELETPRFWRDHFYLSEHHLCGFLERGHYAEQLKRWGRFFGPEQTLIIKSEFFFAHPAAVVENVWRWLGLDAAPMPVFRKWQHVDYPPMRPEMRKRLEAYYRPKVKAIEDVVSWVW